ncbi:hypothetical protein AWV80_32990 [Cupriavidus sp. UYMU48A]|nr:hypothetical protein AWV80_32990 [Cupriavidus sp. UYMU48A]
MRTLVAVPMKAYADAKTRLACAMSPEERRTLAKALFEYGQSFFSTNYPEFDRLVVSPSPTVATAAVWSGASCVYESASRGLNAAATTATQWAIDRGYERLLIVPGDIGVWRQEEVDCLLELSKELDVVVARAHDGGTNALVLRLPCEMQFGYGPQSAARHMAIARQLGKTAVERSLPFLGLDLDTPGDCATLRNLRHSLGVAL